jgi:hypothetical protein
MESSFLGGSYRLLLGFGPTVSAQVSAVKVMVAVRPLLAVLLQLACIFSETSLAKLERL